LASKMPLKRLRSAFFMQTTPGLRGALQHNRAWS
jgi:hypothetical protein